MDIKLGDFPLQLQRFPELQIKLDELGRSIASDGPAKRWEKINRQLLTWIQEQDTPCFLLAAVAEVIAEVGRRQWLSSYTFGQFELWLNQFSGLGEADNYLVRGKIMGKYIPREAYQVLFPIGMGKVHFGSHYVTAHGSPDLDTTVASFWGWVDAFSARVSSGLHVWNIPGGPPKSQIEIEFLFAKQLGSSCFASFAKTRSELGVCVMDLLTQVGMSKKTLTDSVQKIDHGKNAIVIIDEQDQYIGDWNPADGESVRKLTVLLNNCMRFFSSCFQRKLTAIFSKTHVVREVVEDLFEEMFALKIRDSDPAKEFTDRQRKRMELYLRRILGVTEGLDASYADFFAAMERLLLKPFSTFRKQLKELLSSTLFSADGALQEDRCAIFRYLEQVVEGLEAVVQSLRSHVDSLGTAFSIKKEVFNAPEQAICHRAEVEEMRMKMEPFSYLTVTEEDEVGNRLVLGIVKSADAYKPCLGTVSLRDFCNRDETKIPPYFEVISIVDHHKSSISTTAAPVACIADAQSANALVAELAFAMHDSYSMQGSSASQVQSQIAAAKELADPSQMRVLQRLLQKKLISNRQDSYFIDPKREYFEYMHYLYAILDDTDLLSKVSRRDVLCIASLLNRLKSLAVGKEVETIRFDDIPQNSHFVATAAQRILRNEDMYSLYRKVYEAKEEMMDRMIREGSPAIFADTKTQNRCNRVGQTKLFPRNFALYSVHEEALRDFWYQEAVGYSKEFPECKVHMHMISTVPSAEDVYRGAENTYNHQDELWIWIGEEEQAVQYLKSFLMAFGSSPQIVHEKIEVELLGKNKALQEALHESGWHVAKEKDTRIPMAVVRYRAGLLNSRKAMVSPYLPKGGG